MVELRRSNGDYRGAVLSGRGKRLTDQMRKEYRRLHSMEQQLRVARNEDVSRTTIISDRPLLAVCAGTQRLFGLCRSPRFAQSFKELQQLSSTG
jgi:DNA-binding XRE family transcriptional regulator